MALFYEQGFHGTTVDAVLAAALVPKGSFYHHFGSKDAFGQAVLERYPTFQLSLFDKWATKKGLTTTQKLVGYFTEMRSRSRCSPTASPAATPIPSAH